MKRICNDKDIQFHRSFMPPEAPCGRTYDDYYRSTICPHDLLPKKLSEEELQELLNNYHNKTQGEA